MYLKAEPLLKKLQIFKEVSIPYILKKVTITLRETIYLPNDYIIHKVKILFFINQ